MVVATPGLVWKARSRHGDPRQPTRPITGIAHIPDGPEWRHRGLTQCNAVQRSDRATRWCGGRARGRLDQGIPAATSWLRPLRPDREGLDHGLAMAWLSLSRPGWLARTLSKAKHPRDTTQWWPAATPRGGRALAGAGQRCGTSREGHAIFMCTLVFLSHVANVAPARPRGAPQARPAPPCVLPSSTPVRVGRHLAVRAHQRQRPRPGVVRKPSGGGAGGGGAASEIDAHLISHSAECGRLVVAGVQCGQDKGCTAIGALCCCYRHAVLAGSFFFPFFVAVCYFSLLVQLVSPLRAPRTVQLAAPSGVCWAGGVDGVAQGAGCRVDVRRSAT